MKKYDWLPSECAPREFPVEILVGNLQLADGDLVAIPAGKTVLNGWGEIGSTHLVGDDTKALPTKLDITWFSYTENIFYSGSWELPVNEIQEHFGKGLKPHQCIGETPTYDRIVIGMAPGGKVSVWITAIGVNLEVAKFEATEASIPWGQFFDNPDVTRSEYIEIVLGDFYDSETVEQMLSTPVLKNIWHPSQKQYAWKTAIDGAVVKNLWLTTQNGEKDTFNYAEKPAKRSLRGIPLQIVMVWTHRDGKDYISTIKLSKSETQKAFEKLSHGDSDHPMELYIEIAEKSKATEISLKDKEFILKLNKESYHVSEY